MTDEEKRYIDNLKQVLERAKNYSALSAIEKLEEENKKLDESLIGSTKHNIERQEIIDSLKKENAELEKKIKGFVHLLEGVQFVVQSDVDFDTKVSWIEENTIKVFKNEKQNGFSFDWIN